jgi:hypothetical protein
VWLSRRIAIVGGFVVTEPILVTAGLYGVPMFDVDLDSLTPDDLERSLLSVEGQIAELRLVQASLLRAVDVAQVPLADGCRSLQEWTRARLDVTDGTARDLVVAARAVPDQPQVQALADEGVSFDRLVATSRLVASGADVETVQRSLGFDLAGVVRLRERHRLISREDEAAAFRDRYLVLQPALDGSRGSIRGELPGLEYVTVQEALTRRVDELRQLPGPRIPGRALFADALVAVCQDRLDPVAETGGEGHGREPLVSVLVDADLAGQTNGEAGAEIVYGPRVGPLTLERILCGGRVELIGFRDGRPVVASDATRAIPPQLRRLVAWRDGGCVIDGCTSRYRLQVHHIRHRSNGGGHDPENLTTMCWFHHQVCVHGMGLELAPDSPPQRRRFQRALPRGPDPP